MVLVYHMIANRVLSQRVLPGTTGVTTWFSFLLCFNDWPHRWQ